MNRECNDKESKVLQMMNVCHAVETSLFETKVARTAQKTSKASTQDKIKRLKELKQTLISLIAT